MLVLARITLFVREAQVLIETLLNHIWRLPGGKTPPERSEFIFLQAFCTHYTVILKVKDVLLFFCD